MPAPNASSSTPDGETVPLSCPGCGAALDVPTSQRTAQCPYCATPGLVPRAPTSADADPAFVVPFVVAQQQALDHVRHWLRTRSMFARSGLKRASVEKLRGVYVPVGLYSARQESAYDAEIGEDYKEEESYTTTENGKTVTKTRTVTKTEWRSLSGTYASYLTDVVVTAAKGVPNRELERVEPFRLGEMRRMSHEVLVGWSAEVPSLSDAEVTALAHEESKQKIERELRRFLPGDHQRALRFSTKLMHESIDHALLPLWVLAARWDDKKPPVRILVNGQTGAVGGDVPLSPIKITLFVLFILLVIGAGVLVYLWRTGQLGHLGGAR